MDFFLACLPVFKRLPEEALERLSRALALRRYGKGQAIFMDGDAPRAVYLLKSGLVKAVKYSRREEPVTMEIIVPGGLFGMIAVLDRKTYPVSAVCIRDSEAYEIPGRVFEDLLRTNPDFSRAVYSEIGEHLRQAHTLRAMGREAVSRRIAYILHLLAQSMGKELSIGREDIAEMCSTTQETVIRTLSEFRRKKLIASGWKRIVVLRSEGLEKLYSSPDGPPDESRKS
ncbi:MAG: Crp/Fnr family transcriptional regulator [Elusimicrobia bacterium]|nr:Crp/Fnr family transcriptional regulator [Elusimicrobiota bacterium]